jgi:hypothetical protein
MFELVMPQIKELSPYQNYIVAIISVRVKTLTTCFGRAALQHLVYCLVLLAKELSVVIIVPFFEKKNGWCLSQ